MGDRFHKAARDGSSHQGLGLLKEATSRDLNRTDKEGMTPTLIAAECGHLEAMKICIGRGGKANCCNGLGQTALHLATNKGHLHMVNFLSKYYEENDNFIKILFMMDNAEMTAKQIAADRNDQKLVSLLDRCEAHFQKDKARVEKYQGKAQKEMMKNKKQFQEVREKQKKLQEKEGSKKPPANTRKTITTEQRRTIAIKSEDAAGGKSQKKSFFATLGKRMGTVKRKQLLEGLDFSQVDTTGIDGTMTISAGNKNVLFKGGATVKTNGDVGAPSRTDIRDIFDQEANLDDHAYQNDFGGNEISTTGLFTRGGFGQRIFFKQNTALTDQMEHIESEKKFATSFLEDDNDIEQIDSDEEDLIDSEDDDITVDPLQTFLAALNLTEYWPLFKKEEMDLEAVMMATDQDLIQMGLSKGPRIKILRSMDSRRSAMETKETNYDTAF